jgi:hypothetical protein
MTLTETLKQISELMDCDQTAAVKELRKAVADGAFRKSEIRWADPVSRPFGSSEGLAVPDDTPVWADWNKARFRLKGDGALLDNWTGYRRTKKGNPRWRKLLFLRKRVEKLWSLPPKNVSPGKNTSSESKVVPVERAKRGPIPNNQNIIKAAERLREKGLTRQSYNTLEEYRKLLCHEAGVNLNTRGWGPHTVRNVLKEWSGLTTETTEKTESTES